MLGVIKPQPTTCFVNKVLLKHSSYTYSLTIVNGCFHATFMLQQQLSSYNSKPSSLQSLKYLQSSPLQKKFAQLLPYYYTWLSIT